jgi:hypothetical protein
LGFEGLSIRHIKRIRKNNMKNINYDEEVNELMEMAREKEQAEVEKWINTNEAMDDNYLYNLKTGFTLMSKDPYSSSSALGTILLKCAQCMSDHKSDDTLPSCRWNCSLWYFMSEKRYKLPDKKVSQSK